MRTGIFGGTFSPIHAGHIKAAKAFLSELSLDVLYVIPDRIPPHKQITGKDDPWLRLEMVKKAFEGDEKIVVSDVELRREGKSYTVDTLRELTAPDTRLFLFCGTDMFLTLDQWYCADEIFKLCYPIYIRRENDQFITNKILKKIGEYTEKYNAVVRRVVTEPIELSSSRVRKTLREGGDISGMVDPKVKMYIDDHGLFR